jgi:hypothetical protein
VHGPLRRVTWNRSLRLALSACVGAARGASSTPGNSLQLAGTIASSVATASPVVHAATCRSPRTDGAPLAVSATGWWPEPRQTTSRCRAASRSVAVAAAQALSDPAPPHAGERSWHSSRDRPWRVLGPMGSRFRSGIGGCLTIRGAGLGASSYVNDLPRRGKHPLFRGRIHQCGGEVCIKYCARPLGEQ